MKITRVEFVHRVIRGLDRLPRHVVFKLKTWVVDVEFLGLEVVRKRPGFHDEPLRGGRQGQRSVRLNRAYRAIYVELEGEVRIVRVVEVTKHAY